MFEEFSPKYESGFRTFFIIWVIGWTMFNLWQVGVNYIDYESITAGGDAALAEWWFDTFGKIISVSIGFILLFWMSSVPQRIGKGKKISGIPLFMTLTVVYYLFGTIVNLFTAALFNPEDFVEQFVFGTMWLMPSIIILILHMLYYSNLQKYNTYGLPVDIEEEQK